MNRSVARPETQYTTPQWMTAAEIADRLRVHPKTILRLARAGVVPCLRAGMAIRFDPAAVEAALYRTREGR